MIDTILFDLDGTLIDTEPAAALAIEKAFASWGVALEAMDAHFITGRTWEMAFRYLFHKYPIPVSTQIASDLMMSEYRKSLHANLVIVPGGKAAVESLAPHYRLGLVSGSFRSEIFWALDYLGIREHFEVVLGAEDYPRSKPEPDGYLKAMALLSAKPENTLVFEDSQAGIASGRAAQTWVVAISSTNHSRQNTSFAHAQIEDLRPVNSTWVKKLSEKLCGAPTAM